MGVSRHFLKNFKEVGIVARLQFRGRCSFDHLVKLLFFLIPLLQLCKCRKPFSIELAQNFFFSSHIIHVYHFVSLFLCDRCIEGLLFLLCFLFPGLSFELLLLFFYFGKFFSQVIFLGLFERLDESLDCVFANPLEESFIAFHGSCSICRCRRIGNSFYTRAKDRRLEALRSIGKHQYR